MKPICRLKLCIHCHKVAGEELCDMPQEHTPEDGKQYCKWCGFKTSNELCLGKKPHEVKKLYVWRLEPKRKWICWGPIIDPPPVFYRFPLSCKIPVFHCEPHCIYAYRSKRIHWDEVLSRKLSPCSGCCQLSYTKETGEE